MSSNAITTFSSPEQAELTQWLERQIADGATRLILRQKSEEGADTLVREFPIEGGGGAFALADMVHGRAHDDGRHFRGRSLYGVFAHRDREYLDRFFFAVEGEQEQQHFGTREANLSGVTSQLMRHNEANARLAIGQTLDIIAHYKALLAAREKRVEELETKYLRVAARGEDVAIPTTGHSFIRCAVCAREQVVAPDVDVRSLEQSGWRLASGAWRCSFCVAK